MLRYVLAAAAALLVAVPATAQNLLQNGGFEAAPVPGSGGYLTFPPGAPTDWGATTDINLVNGYHGSAGPNLAVEGSTYVDLYGEAANGSIYQDFNTVLGQLYTFSFAYSHNLFGGSQSASGSYNISNSLVSGTVEHTGGSNSNLEWVTFTTTFLGSGLTSTLTFTNLTGGTNAGLLLDRVSISAVPEPEIWAMMLLGFGAVGFQMRRRSGLRTVTA